MFGGGFFLGSSQRNASKKKGSHTIPSSTLTVAVDVDLDLLVRSFSAFYLLHVVWYTRYNLFQVEDEKNRQHQ